MEAVVVAGLAAGGGGLGEGLALGGGLGLALGGGLGLAFGGGLGLALGGGLGLAFGGGLGLALGGGLATALMAAGGGDATVATAGELCSSSGCQCATLALQDLGLDGQSESNT